MVLDELATEILEAPGVRSADIAIRQRALGASAGSIGAAASCMAGEEAQLGEGV